MNSIRESFNAFSTAAQNKAAEAKNTVVEWGSRVYTLMTNVETQQKSEEVVGQKIEAAQQKASTWAKSAVEKMEGAGVSLLGSPIKAMENFNARRLEIKDEMSNNMREFRSGVNKVIKYHENVIKLSDSYSRTAGEKAHAVTRFALTPIRFIAKCLQIEVAGALIQNAVALAVGFTVRALTATIMQLGHVLPYAVATAAAVGVGAGFAALAIKLSPFAAVAAGIALVLAAQQVQIAVLGKRIAEMMGLQAKAATDPGTPRGVETASQAATAPRTPRADEAATAPGTPRADEAATAPGTSRAA